MEDLLPQVKELQEELLAMKKKYADQGKAFLESEFKKLFKKYPEMRMLSWNQYTPFFNDGEPCVFEVHNWTIKINEEDAHEWSEEPSAPWIKVAGKELALILGTLATDDFDIMKDIYGDHATICVTMDRTFVEECDHE